MSVIDDYFEKLSEPERAELERVRDLIRLMVPDAEEVINYGIPAFKHKKQTLLGFAAAKNHLSIYPFSPTAIATLKDKLKGYELTKGTIRFMVDKPIPDFVLEEIITQRLREINSSR